MNRKALYSQGLALVLVGLCAGSTGWAEEAVNVKLNNTYDISTTAAPTGSVQNSAVTPAGATGTGVDNNQPAASVETELFLPNPGEAVVGTESAPVFRIQNPAPAPAAAASGLPSLPSIPLLPALLLLAGIAPALLWISWSRARENKKTAAAVKDPAIAQPAPDKGPKFQIAPVKASPLKAAQAFMRSSAVEPRPAMIEDAEMQALRLEVMGGLKEMRTRTEAFTDALETGLTELQSELARARRTILLLREERVRAEVRMDQDTEIPGDLVELFERADRRRSQDVPAAPEVSPTIFRDADPALDPAWLLLDDASPGIALPAEPARAPEMVIAPPLGEKALKSFARRSSPEPDDFRRALDYTTPGERREMILGLARAGQSIDDIARHVKVGRGEVTLALTRAQGAGTRV